MTDKSFTKPTTVQDFAIRVNPEDMKDGRIQRDYTPWFLDAFQGFLDRFEPQVSPGKGFTIHIRMETEK